MVNYWLLLSPIGIISVGLIAIIYWWRKHKVKPSLFAFGGLLWLIAIILKAVMDLLLTTPVYTYLNTNTQTWALLLISLIIGLRTGFFESGISYLIMKYKLKKIEWKDSIAIGIGFGASEAIVLGTLSLLGMSLLMSPSFIQELSELEKAAIDLLFSQNTIIVFAAWIERLSVLFSHVFATVLVIKAITSKKAYYLWTSIIYKTIVDLPVPYFQLLTGTGDILITYLTQLYFVGMGLAGLYGLKWLKKREPKKRKKR